VSDTEFENVIEIDGPPRAYFEIPLGDEDRVLRIVYKAFIVVGIDAEAAKAVGERALRHIRARVNISNYGGCGIIWWRRHPNIHEADGFFKWTCRLATSPELPDGFWNALGGRDAYDQFIVGNITENANA
jgi:hypothetical protein